MEGISVLPDEVFLLVLQYLDTQDRIAFAYSCTKVRKICMDGGALRQVDLSRCLLRGHQYAIIRKFLRDREMVQHIRELNLNNHRVVNWQISVDIEQFIISICPHLESLHVVNCGMNPQSLQCILQQAPNLTSLSWSLLDLTFEDIEFLKKGMESSDGICLQKVKHLHLEILESKPYLRILKYLVLSCCKYVEELEIFIWKLNDIYGLERNSFKFWNDITFPQPSLTIDKLQQLHSLMIQEVGNEPHPSSLGHFDWDPVLKLELIDFVSSVVSKKSRETEWKKIWISPHIPVDILWDKIHSTASSVPLLKDIPHELHSVEALTVHAKSTLFDFKTLFQIINDSSVKNLHLCANHYLLDLQVNSIVEFYNPILRIGGDALRFLSLSVEHEYLVDAVQVDFHFSRLFSRCSNITKLDLLECHFQKDICGPLSKLKHLVKIQVPHCAILLKEKKTNANLQTLMRNCQNIAEFDVRGCEIYTGEFSCCTFNDDLLALCKLTKLESLTLYNIYDLEQCTFLENVSEHCKFLTTLRIKSLNSLIRFPQKHSYIIALKSMKFLKHLVIDVPYVDLGSEHFWKLLSRATNLERLCIKSVFNGSINVPCAIKMLKSLPRLHVLYVQILHARNLIAFRKKIIRALEEEKSYRIYCFEFLTCEGFFTPRNCWIYRKVLPINIAELCYMTPSMARPTF